MDRIQQRRDTAARWAQFNPILLEGEVGYVTDDPNQYKIGDGVHTWNDLPLRGFDGTLVHALDGSANTAMSTGAITKYLDLLSSQRSFSYWIPYTSAYITKNDSGNCLLVWSRLAFYDPIKRKTYGKWRESGYSLILPTQDKSCQCVVYLDLNDEEIYFDGTNLPLDLDGTGYKRIQHQADVVILGLVDINSNRVNFKDYLLCSTPYWIAGDSNDARLNHLDEVISNIPKDYTYWPPSVKPVFDVQETTKTVTFRQLTVVRYFIGSVILNSYSQVVTMPAKSIPMWVYYDLDDKKIHYVVTDNVLQSDDNGMEDAKIVSDISRIILLGCVEGNNYIDYLSLHSRYISGPGYFDLSVEGIARKLYPENKRSIEKVIFLTYDFSKLCGVVNGTALDLRIHYDFHTKVRGIRIEGNYSGPKDGKNVLGVYIADTKTLTNSYMNQDYINNLVDGNGNFVFDIILPESAWNDEIIDFERGYKVIVLCANYDRAQCELRVTKAYGYCYPNDEAPTLPIDEIRNKLLPIADVIKVTKDFTVYGNANSEVTYDMVYPYASHTNYSVTTMDSQCTKDGFLKEISVIVSAAGTFTFKVGLLDQYPRFVVSQQFDVRLQGGLNVVDVSSLNIPIKKGEQVAVSCTSKNSTASIMYDENEEDGFEHELFYGINNSTWGKLATEYGGRVYLNYKIIEIETPLALSFDVERVEAQVQAQQTNINSMRYVYDENNAPYKIVVRNGELSLKAVQYKKVLALGNSLTSHGYAEHIGYYGDLSWAMASTNKETTTWTTFLRTILRTKQPTAEVTPLNIAAWETNYMGVDLDTLFASHKGIDYDLIVFRAGENGTAGIDYSQGVDKLISYLRENFINADIIITSMFWPNATKETAFKEIATKYSYPYLQLPAISDRCVLGQMLMGRDDVLHPIIHNGVAGHCTDVCFFDFANILADSLGYSQITGKHSVTINTSLKYDINNNYQIKDGYVSILTYNENTPNISVRDSSNNVVEITNHSLADISWINTPSEVPTYVTTFKMPNSDVTVTIL